MSLSNLLHNTFHWNKTVGVNLNNEISAQIGFGKTNFTAHNLKILNNNILIIVLFVIHKCCITVRIFFMVFQFSGISIIMMKRNVVSTDHTCV